MRAILIVMMACVVGGCSNPQRFATGPMTKWDDDNRYHVEPKPGGFLLTVYSSDYQFFPSPGALVATTKSNITAIAHELAAREGKRIKPIDEQKIKISTGRNGWSGSTKCSAQVPVEYAE